MLRIRPALKLRIGSRAAREKRSTGVARIIVVVTVTMAVAMTVRMPSAGIAASKERAECAEAGL